MTQRSVLNLGRNKPHIHYFCGGWHCCYGFGTNRELVAEALDFVYQRNRDASNSHL